MYCYCIEKRENQKKGHLIKMAPTLKILGVYLQVFVLWGLAGMEQLSADKSKDRPPKN